MILLSYLRKAVLSEDNLLITRAYVSGRLSETLGTKLAEWAGCRISSLISRGPSEAPAKKDGDRNLFADST